MPANDDRVLMATEDDRNSSDDKSSLELPDKTLAKGRRSRHLFKRGRKYGLKGDVKTNLEGSRKSARECRVRRKLRYQYLEEMVASRERAILALREELELYKSHCSELDDGRIPKPIQDLISRSVDKE